MGELDWVRRTNYLAEALGDQRHLVDLDPNKMITTAEAITGLTDFGDTHWKPGYRADLEFFNWTDNSLLMSLITKTRALIALRNRLLIVDELKRDNTISSKVINKPIFITGLHRSGTTLLFNLLSKDSNLRAPLGFEACSPLDPASCKTTAKITRQEIGQCMYDFLSDMLPDLKCIHEFGSDLPVECSEILMYVLATPFWPYDQSSETYESRISQIDAIYNFSWHKKVIQLLQPDIEKNWLFKCPTHIHFLNELFLTYPDARVIHLHRDPRAAIPSLLSLIKSRHPSIGPREIEQTLLFCEGGLKDVIDRRIKGLVPQPQIVDVNFDNLVERPEATIRALYSQLDMTFSSELNSNITKTLITEPRHRFGRHHYSSEDFGLTNGEILERFKFYSSYYDIPLKNLSQL